MDSTGAESAPAPETDVVAKVTPEVEVAVEELDVDADSADETETAAHAVAVAAEVVAEPFELAEQVEATETVIEQEPEEAVETPAAKSGPGFSKLLDGIANLTGFYGQGVNVDLAVPIVELTDDTPVEVEPETEVTAEEFASDAAVSVEMVDSGSGSEDELLLVEPDGAAPEIEPDPIEPDSSDQSDEEPAEVTATQVEPQSAQPLEGPLQDQLAQVRAKAEEARQAQLRVTQALHESLSAAYDFALDAEGSPEEYLRRSRRRA